MGKLSNIKKFIGKNNQIASLLTNVRCISRILVTGALTASTIESNEGFNLIQGSGLLALSATAPFAMLKLNKIYEQWFFDNETFEEKQKREFSRGMFA